MWWLNRHANWFGSGRWRPRWRWISGRKNRDRQCGSVAFNGISHGHRFYKRFWRFMEFRRTSHGNRFDDRFRRFRDFRRLRDIYRGQLRYWSSCRRLMDFDRGQLRFRICEIGVNQEAPEIAFREFLAHFLMRVMAIWQNGRALKKFSWTLLPPEPAESGKCTQPTNVLALPHIYFLPRIDSTQSR
jgi:hypothetical protein